MSRFHDAVNEQIGYEFGASQQYIAIAVYYDSGDAAAARRALLPPGGRGAEPRDDARPVPARRRPAVKIPGVEAPKTEFTDAVAPVALALEQEKRVTSQIAALAALAREEGDFVGEQFLHWFLKEQREEVSSMSDLLKLVERAAESNLLLAEESLARTAVGDGVVDPSAPPAAGGAL